MRKKYNKMILMMLKMEFLEDNNVEQTSTQTVWRKSVRLTVIEDYVMTIWRKITMAILRKK